MKQSEIKNLSETELTDKLSELQNTYAELKSAHAISPIENPLQIKTIRRAIARVNTQLRIIELQQL